jgi:hypothetical protein
MQTFLAERTNEEKEWRAVLPAAAEDAKFDSTNRRGRS